MQVSKSTMEPTRATPERPVRAVVTLIVASAFSMHPLAHATAPAIPTQPPEFQPVRLTLACVDSTTIRFEITNVGSTDTALPLGSALANGRKYMIDNLSLRMKPSNG